MLSFKPSWICLSFALSIIACDKSSDNSNSTPTSTQPTTTQPTTQQNTNQSGESSGLLSGLLGKEEKKEGGLTTVPTELHGKWYSAEACKDCEVTECYGEITASSLEYIKSFDGDWRTSHNKEKKGMDKENDTLSPFAQYKWENNVLKGNLGPSFELRGDTLLVSPSYGDKITLTKNKPECDFRYTMEKSKASAAKFEADQAAAARVMAEKNAPYCAQYVDCSCGMNDNLISYYEGLGIELPVSSRKAMKKSCSMAKRWMKKGTKSLNNTCKKSLKQTKSTYKMYTTMGIDVPSACTDI